MKQFHYCFNKKGINLKLYIYRNASYHYNWHKDIELLTVINGEVEVSIDGENRILGTDDVFLINSNLGHATLARKSNSITMLLRIDPDFFKEYYPEIEHIHFDCSSNESNRYREQFVRLRSHLASMILCSLEDTQEYRFLFKSELYSLVYEIVSNYPPISITSKNFVIESNRQKIIKRITEYIDKNYKQKISLDDIAEIGNYNRNYVSHLFKSHIGINFYDYMTRIRLREATLELGKNEKTISEVALTNGFPDIKSFNKAFKSSFGKTPTEYINQLNDDIIKYDSIFHREYVDVSDEFVMKKVRSYLIDYRI